MVSAPRIFNGLTCLAIAGVIFLSYPASAQQANTSDYSRKIRQLEMQVESLSRQVYRNDFAGGGNGGAAPSGNVANLEIRLGQMEGELRRLTGQIERQDYLIKQMQDRVERQLNDMSIRLSDMENGRGSGGGTSPLTGLQQPQGMNSKTIQKHPIVPQQPQTSTPDTTQTGGTLTSNDKQPVVNASAGTGTVGTLGTLSYNDKNEVVDPSGEVPPEAFYDNAFNLIKNRDYDNAEKQFRNFIDQFPGHALTENAYYWLGETYYVREEYERAARTFATGYKSYPEGNKAPDNLLKLGLSLNGLGNRDDACIALLQLQQKFPKASQPVSNRANAEIKRLGCDA